MGYRSEVGLALLEEDYNKLLELAKPLIERFGENTILSDKPTRIEKYGEFYIYLHWDYLKWYQSFDEVDLIENFIKDHPHSFLRIGEDYDDIQYDVNDGDGVYDFFWSIQYPMRKISFWSEFNEQTDD